MSSRPGRLRAERLLPIACLLAAAVLFTSELMTMFQFTPPGGEALQEQTAHARHGNAMFVIAGFAILALLVAVSAGSKPAATGVAAMGAVALLVFLINDLPDAGQIGTLSDVRQSFFDAEAVPQAGFWLEMIGAIGLALSGVALATLSSEQLLALRRGGRRDEAVRSPTALPSANGAPQDGDPPQARVSGDRRRR